MPGGDSQQAQHIPGTPGGCCHSDGEWTGQKPRPGWAGARPRPRRSVWAHWTWAARSVPPSPPKALPTTVPSWPGTHRPALPAPEWHQVLKANMEDAGDRGARGSRPAARGEPRDGAHTGPDRGGPEVCQVLLWPKAPSAPTLGSPMGFFLGGGWHMMEHHPCQAPSLGTVFRVLTQGHSSAAHQDSNPIFWAQRQHTPQEEMGRRGGRAGCPPMTPPAWSKAELPWRTKRHRCTQSSRSLGCGDSKVGPSLSLVPATAGD